MHYINIVYDIAYDIVYDIVYDIAYDIRCYVSGKKVMLAGEMLWAVDTDKKENLIQVYLISWTHA